MREKKRILGIETDRMHQIDNPLSIKCIFIGYSFFYENMFHIPQYHDFTDITSEEFTA